MNSITCWRLTVLIVKRPILIGDGFVLAGFNEADWKAALGIGYGRYS